MFEKLKKERIVKFWGGNSLLVHGNICCVTSAAITNDSQWSFVPFLNFSLLPPSSKQQKFLICLQAQFLNIPFLQFLRPFINNGYVQGPHCLAVIEATSK